MFNSTSCSSDDDQYQADSTSPLYMEALNRYHHLFGAIPNNRDVYQRPSLVEARFGHLTQVLHQERQQAMYPQPQPLFTFKP